MVKIIYGEHRLQAELAGKSVAEVRELYKANFSMPNRAKASLNGQQLEKKLETQTRLSDDDKLLFEVKNRKGLALVGAFLLALTITGGLFAYTYTVVSSTITVTVGGGDFAEVAANATPDYTVQGRTRGAIDAEYLFDITNPGGYTGDVEVQVMLSNAEEISRDYSFWMLRMELVNSTASANVGIPAITQVLSLDTPMVSFALDSTNLTAGAYVYTPGGSYRSFPQIWITGADPVLFCQVVQREPEP